MTGTPEETIGSPQPPSAGALDQARLVRAVERAAAVFLDKNMRFTRLRQQVFAEIAATREAIGAYDILERLAEKGNRFAPISIYRAIDALIAAGVVHRLESRNAYFACRILHGGERRQLIQACERCGTVTEVDGEAIFAAIDDISRASGFTPHVRFVEVTGLCPACRAKEQPLNQGGPQEPAGA